jgi:hypothetical protein
MIKPGQIVYANLTFRTKKGGTLVAKQQVIAREYDKPLKTVYTKKDDEYALARFKIKEDVTLVSLEIIADLGMKNKSNGYSVVNKSESDERQDNGSFQ